MACSTVAFLRISAMLASQKRLWSAQQRQLARQDPAKKRPSLSHRAILFAGAQFLWQLSFFCGMKAICTHFVQDRFVFNVVGCQIVTFVGGLFWPTDLLIDCSGLSQALLPSFLDWHQSIAHVQN